MTTAAEVIGQAERWIGAREQPPGSNHVPGITDRMGCNASWCAWCNMAVSVWLTDAGIDHNRWAVAAEVTGARNGDDGFTWIGDPYAGQPGDLVVFNWKGGAEFDHIGLVKLRLAAGDYATVEGNVGDACGEHRRRAGFPGVVGFVRPPYRNVKPLATSSPVIVEDIEMPGPGTCWLGGELWTVGRGRAGDCLVEAWGDMGLIFGWTSIGGQLTSSPDIESAGDELVVVGRGLDMACHFNERRRHPDAWTGWQRVPSSGGGVLTSAPSIAARADGRLDVVARGLDGAVWHTWRSPAGVWAADWDSFAGQT